MPDYVEKGFKVGDNYMAVKDAVLTVVGFTALVWIEELHRDLPYNNPSLKLIIEIYERGVPISTGYLDVLITAHPINPCKVLSISQRSDADFSNSPWLSFFPITTVDW